MNSNLKKVVIIFVFLLGLFLISLTNLKAKNIFNSPDESSNYQSMVLFSKTNKPYYIENMAKYDTGNNLHSRGFLTIKNKIVPFNFPGVWAMYGVIYKFIGDNVRFINLVFFSLITFSIYQIICVVTRKKFNILLALFSVICNLPIMYYLNLPYFDITPGVTFFSLALLFLVKYYEQPRKTYLFIGSVILAGLSLWFAMYWALFYLYIYGVQVITNIKNYKKNYVMWLLSALSLIIVFLIPLFLLNNNLYGNPFTIGMTVFTKTFFYQDRASNIYQNIITYLFPSREIRVDILANNILSSLVYISPIYLLTAFLGLTILLKKYKKLLLYAPLLIWFLLYNGTSDTYLSGSSAITLTKAIIRYWLPFYLVLCISFNLYLIQQKNNFLKLLIIFGCVVFLPLLLTEINNNNQALAIYQSINLRYQPYINKNAYILSASQDKYLFQVAKPITWWRSYGNDIFFHPAELNSLISNLLKEGKVVYLQRTKELDTTHVQQITLNNLITEKIVNDLYQIKLKTL